MSKIDLRENPPAKIEFIEHHLPVIKDGEFTVKLEQQVTLKGVALTPLQKESKFSVQGARFSLKPNDIGAVFPPSGSLGDHANVLPHIILKRSTLPWERIAEALTDEEKSVLSKDESVRTPQEKTLANTAKKKEETPWLALLVLEEDEIIPSANNPKEHVDNLELKDLKVIDSTRGWPGITLEVGQSEVSRVSVINVKADAVKNLMPTANELRFLTHVRQGVDSNDQVILNEAGKVEGGEWAVVAANRLPEPGVTNFVHLVSVENRYEGGTFNQGQSAESYRFVSLKNWRFTCLKEQPDFAQILKNLTKVTSDNTLRIPKYTAADAGQERFLSQGYVFLRHLMRGGDKSVSLYRSPFVPVQPSAASLEEFPVEAADKLIRFHEDFGIFDETYAAAWELGRLMALRSKSFSVELNKWKRTHAQQVRILEQAEQRPHLSFQQVNKTTDLQLPEKVESWLSDLSLLKGIPFNYLVPDEKMLPVESIRFFNVDPRWIASLVDGAFSLGRVTATDHHLEASNRQKLAPINTEPVSGFLLRSSVVSGWPNLLVDGYDKSFQAGEDQSGILTNSLPIWRMERLAPDLLLCLFNGDMKVLDLHLKPEMLHFGFDQEKSTGAGMTKSLRNADGDMQQGQAVNLETDNLIKASQVSKRVIRVEDLYRKVSAKSGISNFNPAHFAMIMTEGIERVRFIRTQ